MAEVIKVMIALEIAKNYQKWKQDIEKLQKRKPEKQTPACGYKIRKGSSAAHRTRARPISFTGSPLEYAVLVL